MDLVPIDNTGQQSLLFQLLPGNLAPYRAEADAFSRLTDAQQGDALAVDAAPVAECFHCIAPPVMPGHHAQAGGAAVHGIMLAVGSEGAHKKQIPAKKALKFIPVYLNFIPFVI